MAGWSTWPNESALEAFKPSDTSVVWSFWKHWQMRTLTSSNPEKMMCVLWSH